MRTIVHLSDLHFGAIDERVLAPLAGAIAAATPDLLAVSGDLTQRARRREFKHARAFLDSLPWPRIVVPGNHDVPLYDFAARFIEPTRSFQRHITSDLAPVVADDEMVVAGLNSARSWAFRHGPGRLNEHQIRRAAARLGMAAPGTVRIIVTHHPFDVPPGYAPRHVIGRASVAMSWLAAANVDLFLAGHLHVRHIGHTATRYGIAGHSALVVQAGTVSLRGRGELSSFNVLRITSDRIVVEPQVWSRQDGGFRAAPPEVFERGEHGWKPAVEAAPHGRV